MKTLLILSALATIAIAAPAPDEYTDDVQLTPSDFTISQQREKKSTILAPLAGKSSEVLESNPPEKTTNKSGLGSSVARTFSGFKKPIIVKKKIGYHLYRDSDEELAQADPRESCRKQIKVKLCDETNSVDKMKSASVDHAHEVMSEHEMEHNIKMAKEAVEMFQQDLRKMDHDMSDKTRHDHMATGEHKDLQDDIEKARIALEHIQRKFRNLDLVTASKEVDNSDIHLKMISDKPEAERLAQWKKAMENNNPNLEIARNLEDNFKTASEIDTLRTKNSQNLEHDNLNNMNIRKQNNAGLDMRLVTSEDNLNTQVHSKKNEAEDIMTSVPEDKLTKMEIHSDSLKKSKSTSEDVQQKEQIHETDTENVLDKDLSNQRKSSESENNSECNSHDNMNKNEPNKLEGNKEREIEDNHKKFKSEVDLESHDGNTMMKFSDHNIKFDDSSSKGLFKAGDISSDNKQQSELLRSTKTDDLVTHESQHIDTHDLNNHNERVHQQIDAQRSAHQILSPETQLKSINKGNERAHKSEMGLQRSSLSMSISDWNKQKPEFIKRIDGHTNKLKVNETSASERATTNFHKELLNNMEFSEDSHQKSLGKLPLKETGHMLKNEKPELHERLSVPQVHPDSEHFKTMMHFSDSSQHKPIENPTQLKMAFNNESPNLHLHSNNMPLREATEIHSHHESVAQLSKAPSPLNNIPTDLHDPLKIRWAHENNMNFAHMKDAQSNSQFHKGDLEILEDPQRINFEKSMPFRTSTNDGQHMQLHDQMNTRWAQQGMNAQKSADMNSGLALQNVQSNLHMNENSHHTHPISKNVNNFDGFVNQDAFMSSNDHMMMHSSNNFDSSMQPSTFMNMRSMPKMAFEHTAPSNWAHNHGGFRTSYGPGVASYGAASGGGGSNTVGYFPNANVGNCAVPLLLSCSPSVVSGSLAKANTYSAPAYRSEDINFLKKRDIDVNQPTHGVNVHRHTSENHKPQVILEKKQ